MGQKVVEIEIHKSCQCDCKIKEEVCVQINFIIPKITFKILRYRKKLNQNFCFSSYELYHFLEKKNIDVFS